MHVFVKLEAILRAAKELETTKSGVAGFAFKSGDFELIDWGELQKSPPEKFDSVNKPKHYNSHPSGIQCIEVTRHMGFNLGNVVKYVWRADLKADVIEDLKKARGYLDDEIALREGIKRET